MTYENIHSYEEMNPILANLRKLNPEWTIKGGFDKQGKWNFTDILENILKQRIIEIEIDELDIENLDLEGYGEFHTALRDIREKDPGWSINGTRREYNKLFSSTEVGLPKPNNSSEDENNDEDLALR